MLVLGQLGIAGGRVGGEALDEQRHGDDEADAHEEDAVPVGGHPLGDRQQRVLV